MLAWLRPTRFKLATTLLVLSGVLLGLGSFTFVYGKGLSYFSTDPRACINCHIMDPQFDSWQKSSHHTSAVCVDCHLPHDFVGKYLAKADHGFWHSWGFTFQDFHEPIELKHRSARQLQDNCIRCHADFVHALLPGNNADDEALTCVHCHADAGHGPRAGLGR